MSWLGTLSACRKRWLLTHLIHVLTEPENVHSVVECAVKGKMPSKIATEIEEAPKMVE
jgi:selenophosphate synthetase-related protein